MYIYFAHNKEGAYRCNIFNNEINRLYNLRKYIPKDSIENPVEKERNLLHAEEYNRILKEEIEQEVYNCLFRNK